MSDSTEQYVLGVMSGEDRTLRASLLRGILRAAEPVYRGIVTARNLCFDAGLGVKRLPRPVVSVGNLTTGGTGKTPVVRWLCEQFLAAGHRPAVLLRGYKSFGGVSDEQRLLENLLNPASGPRVIVRANPNRFTGGSDVLLEQPQTDLFVLDDGFQHRKLARDFDLVLINAAHPFGFGHVHPRGLLREPLRGLRRADAVLITRADSVTALARDAIETRVRRYHPGVPIYHASHSLAGFRRGDAETHPPEALAGRRVFLFCGIGDPQSFRRQIEQLGGQVAGTRWFPDHFPYTALAIAELEGPAADAGADLMITTEKDWTKLAGIPVARETKMPLWRSELKIQFRAGDEMKLFETLRSITHASWVGSSTPAQRGDTSLQSR